MDHDCYLSFFLYAKTFCNFCVKDLVNILHFQEMISSAESI